jgi:iron complex outermembrane receptor protein
VATGVKGPAFNVNTSTLGDAQPAKPETSTSYEAGFKSQFLDRRITANLSLYSSTFKNFQTQGSLFLPGSVLGTIVLLNAGKLVTQGFEAEISAAVTDSTYLSVNATYIDATFKEFSNAQCYPGQAIIAPGTCINNSQDLSGSRLPNSPKWSFNVFAKQEIGVPGTPWRGFGTLDYSWRGSIQWNVTGSPYGIEPSYGLLGASLGVHNEKGTVSAKLYGKNLTSQFHTSGISVSDQVTMFLPPDYQRIFGVDVSVRF